MNKSVIIKYLLFYLIIILCACKNKKIYSVNTIEETRRYSVGTWSVDTSRVGYKFNDEDPIQIEIDTMFKSETRPKSELIDEKISNQYNYYKYGVNDHKYFGNEGFGSINYNQQYLNRYGNYFSKANINSLEFRFNKVSEVDLYLTNYISSNTFKSSKLPKFKLINSDTAIFDDRLYFYKKYSFFKTYDINFFFSLYKNKLNLKQKHDVFYGFNGFYDFTNSQFDINQFDFIDDPSQKFNFDILTIFYQYLNNTIIEEGIIVGSEKNKDYNNEIGKNFKSKYVLKIRNNDNSITEISYVDKEELKTKEEIEFYNNLKKGTKIRYKCFYSISSPEKKNQIYFIDLKIID